MEQKNSILLRKQYSLLRVRLQLLLLNNYLKTFKTPRKIIIYTTNNYQSINVELHSTKDRIDTEKDKRRKSHFN